MLEVWVYVGIVHISTGHLGILMILFFIATGTHTLDIIKWSLIEVVGSRCKEFKTQRAFFDFKRRHFTIGVCWIHGSGVRRRPRFYKIPILPIVTIIFFLNLFIEDWSLLEDDLEHYTLCSFWYTILEAESVNRCTDCLNRHLFNPKGGIIMQKKQVTCVLSHSQHKVFIFCLFGKF